MPIANEELDALDNAPSKMVSTAPEKIYLLVADADYSAEEFPRDHDVHWCADPALDCNVPYIRADIAQRLTATIREQAAEIERLTREHRYWLKQAAEYAVELSGLEPHYDLPLRINGVSLDELEAAVNDGYQTSAATQLDMITLVRLLMSGSRTANYEEQPDGSITEVDPSDRGTAAIAAQGGGAKS